MMPSVMTKKGKKTYVINPDLCTECLGFYVMNRPVIRSVRLTVSSKMIADLKPLIELMAKYKQIWGKS